MTGQEYLEEIISITIDIFVVSQTTKLWISCSKFDNKKVILLDRKSDAGYKEKGKI